MTARLEITSEALATLCAADPEFMLAARHWDGGLRLQLPAFGAGAARPDALPRITGLHGLLGRRPARPGSGAASPRSLPSRDLTGGSTAGARLDRIAAGVLASSSEQRIQGPTHERTDVAHLAGGPSSSRPLSASPPIASSSTPRPIPGPPLRSVRSVRLTRAPD